MRGVWYEQSRKKWHGPAKKRADKELKRKKAKELWTSQRSASRQCQTLPGRPSTHLITTKYNSNSEIFIQDVVAHPLKLLTMDFISSCCSI